MRSIPSLNDYLESCARGFAAARASVNRCSRRYRAGGAPNRRLKARLNAASDSYPTSAAMSATPRGVADIAAEVGYESEAAFNRAFKRLFGTPPARYRREHRSTDAPAAIAPFLDSSR